MMCISCSFGRILVSNNVIGPAWFLEEGVIDFVKSFLKVQ